MQQNHWTASHLSISLHSINLLATPRTCEIKLYTFFGSSEIFYQAFNYTIAMLLLATLHMISCQVRLKLTCFGHIKVSNLFYHVSLAIALIPHWHLQLSSNTFKKWLQQTRRWMSGWSCLHTLSNSLPTTAAQFWRMLCWAQIPVKNGKSIPLFPLTWKWTFNQAHRPQNKTFLLYRLNKDLQVVWLVCFLCLVLLMFTLNKVF